MNMHYDLAKTEIATRLHHAETRRSPSTRGPSSGRVSRRVGSGSAPPDRPPRALPPPGTSRPVDATPRRARGRLDASDTPLTPHRLRHRGSPTSSPRSTSPP